jgi:hypothetical protein
VNFAFFETLKRNLKPEVEVKEADAHITDALFADEAAEMLCELIKAQQTQRRISLFPARFLSVSGNVPTSSGARTLVSRFSYNGLAAHLAFQTCDLPIPRLQNGIFASLLVSPRPEAYDFYAKTEPTTECSSFSYYAESGCNERTSSIICEKNTSMGDAYRGIARYSYYFNGT